MIIFEKRTNFAKHSKLMRKYILTLGLSFFSVLITTAQESQTVYNFLRLPMSAHAAALGGDNISLIDDDATLVYSNPALLSSVSDKTIAMSYMNYMSGANLAGAVFNRVIKEKCSWAVSAQYLDYGKIKEVDADNVQTGDFSAKDIAVNGHFSYMLSTKFVGGISAKLINSYIGSYSSLAMGVDLGLNYYDADSEWSISAVVKNLGGQLSAFDDDYEAMPLDIQLGASKQFEHVPLRLSATLVDLNHWHYHFINHFVIGADIMLSSSVWIGAGYNFRRADEMTLGEGDDESSHGAGFSFGAGLNLERFKVNVAYGKYHVASSSLSLNLAYSL